MVKLSIGDRVTYPTGLPEPEWGTATVVDLDEDRGVALLETVGGRVGYAIRVLRPA